jgi:predicted enzyme related to lactoylglutathione lyase
MREEGREDYIEIPVTDLDTTRESSFVDPAGTEFAIWASAEEP